MQIQALSLVLTWLHKWVSKFKNSWTKEPPWSDWDLFGCWSAQLLQEGGRETAHILRTRLCLAQVPAAREGTEQLYNLCAPSLLQGCHNPPARTGSVPHGTTQQRVCQAAAVLWLSVISGRITLQICSVLLQAHLCFFSVTAEGLGVEARWGVVCQLTTEIYFFNTLTWLLSTVCRVEKKKAPLIALISSAIQGWHSLQQKDVSLPTLLTLMSCFLCNWLSQTAHVC